MASPSISSSSPVPALAPAPGAARDPSVSPDRVVVPPEATRPGEEDVRLRPGRDQAGSRDDTAPRDGFRLSDDAIERLGREDPALEARIRALIRPRAEADAAFVAMVEENEVREELSHFERGRIAVIAANQGAFANVEDAVNRLYATGSKAKRSKVRSFALIFEELGDMLRFPEALTEKRGLRLSAALRNGSEGKLRQALSSGAAEDAEGEWQLLEPVIVQAEMAPRSPSRGGRPRARQPAQYGWIDDQTIRTSSGVTIRHARDGKAHVLRIEGSMIDNDLMESLMLEIRALLER